MLNSLSLKGFEQQQQRNSSRANVISRPNNDERLGFIPGTFETYQSCLLLSKELLVYLIFHPGKGKSSCKFRLVSGNKEVITFPRQKFPSIIDFIGIPDGQGTQIW